MKLLATDMDGTFLRDDKSYSEEFNDLYKQMLKQGIQFVIASGNQYEALACKFDEEIKNDLYYLCENGTKIVYQGKTLYKKALKKGFDIMTLLIILFIIISVFAAATGLGFVQALLTILGIAFFISMFFGIKAYGKVLYDDGVPVLGTIFRLVAQVLVVYAFIFPACLG